MTSRAAVFGTLSILLASSCMVSEPVVRQRGRSFFSDLVYAAAAERYREVVEKKFEAQDHSYVLSLLTYAVTSLYGRELESSRRAFTAAYRVDEGNIPEAAKFYQWLVVDARTVYRLTKRERELVHFYLGLNYLFEDDLEGALVEFKKLRQRDQDASQLPLVNFYMGMVYEKLEMYDDALIEYRDLREMGHAGRHALIDADALVARVEALRKGEPGVAPGNTELVIHVDHQFPKSMGKVTVYADGEVVEALPGQVDCFEVQLTEQELARKQAQEAGAIAARAGIRILAGVLGRHFLGDSGDDLAEFFADVLVGKEDENRDKRAWGYAPVAMSAERFEIPVGTDELRLEFFGRSGGRLGTARYPLDGGNRRVVQAAGMRFVLAGLAEEFYSYQ